MLPQHEVACLLLCDSFGFSGKGSTGFFPFHRGWLVAARILAYHHIIEDSLFETSFHEYTSGKPCQILRKPAGHVQMDQ
jgi:hypothetical protein